MIPLACLLLVASGVDVDLEAAYESRAFPDGWARMTATVRAEEGFVGAVRMWVRGSGIATAVYERPITLGPNGRKRFRWDLYLSGWEKEVEVELLDRKGTRVLQKTRAVNFVPDQEIHVVIAGRTPSSLGRVQQPLGIAPIWVEAESVPDDPIPLLAADVVIVTEPEKLEWGQQEALREWAEAGGRLVVNSSTNVAALRQGFWRDLLPWKVTGTVGLPIETEEGTETILLAAGQPTRGKSFLPLGGVDLGVRARLGRGEIVFLRFPAGPDDRRNIPPRLPMWRSILGLEAEGPLARIRGWRATPVFADTVGLVRSFAPETSPLRFLQAGLGLLPLGAYVLYLSLASFRFRLSRRRKSLRRAWIPYLVLTAACSAILLLFGHLFIPPSISLHHVVFADEGVTQTFSRIRGGEGRWHVIRAEAALSAVEWLPDWTGRRAIGWRRVPPSEMHLPLAVGSGGVFTTCRASKEAGVGAFCRWEDREGRRIRLGSGGGVDLVRCHLVMGDRVVPLPDLRAGSDFTIGLDRLESVSFERWVKRLDEKPEGRFGAFGRRWTWGRWKRPEHGLFELTFFRRWRVVTDPNERYAVRHRGLDLSGALDRGAAVFVAIFHEDLTGISTDVPAVEGAVGIVRCVLEP